MHHASPTSDTGSILAVPFTCPALSAQPSLKHGFFTRSGGVSHGLYTSLNCAYGTGDKTEHVIENYRRITHALGVADHALCKPYQIHSATVITATQGWSRDDAPQADAVVTNVPGLALGVTTADCLPILFADSTHRVIAATHAGWKGAIGGIIEATLEAMSKLGATPETTIASIGPAIAQGSYEVSSEFYERFITENEGNHLFFLHGARQGHYLFDLKSYAKERLRNAGLSSVNVLAHDTCFEENDFFSYRRATLRSEASYGCQLSAIVLEK